MALTQISEKGIKDGEIINADINASAAIARTKLANVDLVDDTSPQLGGDLASNGNHILIADSTDSNDDRIKVGDGGDLQIYHDGSNSYLAETGDGKLILSTYGSGIDVYDSQHSAYAAKFTRLGQELYYENSKKLETTSGGVTVSHSDDSGATTLKLENNSTHNSQNPKVKIAVDLASGKDGGSIEFIRGNNYQSSAAADSEIVISPTKNDTNQEAVRITQDWFRLHSNCSGIQFNSDTASANALNDYEEGTWTPHIDGWDTYTPYSGSSYHYNWYVKVGKLVHIGWKLYIQNLTTVSSDAHIRMTGVPFAHDSSGAGPIGHMRFDIPEFGMSGYPMVYLGGGGTTIYMYKHVNGGNNLVAMNAAANRSNVWCMGTATYATS